MKKWNRVTSHKKIKGAGDVVELIAQPVAGLIDHVLGTDIKNCGKCKERRDRLNDLIPFEE